MNKEFFEETKIPYISYRFSLDGEEIEDDDGKSITNEEFYEKMKNGAMPKTSQINSEWYIEFWEQYLKEGKDVIHIY